jgi:hypothetical protein
LKWLKTPWKIRNKMLINNVFNWWIGVVEDRHDPEKLGRARVRIVGVHSDDLTILPTSELPWAIPLQPTTSAAVSGIGSAPVGLLQGTWCVGFFIDGDDMQQPVIMGTLGGTPRSTKVCEASTTESTTNPSNAVRAVDGSPVLDGSGNPILQEVPSDTATLSDTTSILAPLSNDQIKLLMNAIAFKESSSVVGGVQNYSAKNQLNYVGKYQFGAAALATLGYIKFTAGTKLNNSLLLDPANWTAKDGLTSLDAYFQAAEIQESIMFQNLVFNYKVLTRKNAITANDTAGKVAGLLSVSHLLGAGGAIAYASGNDTKDGNGVSGNTYYNLGANAVSTTTPSASIPNSNIPTDTSAAGPLNDIPASTPSAFSDPNNQYPECSYAGLADTNKLAAGDTLAGTPIEKRTNNRRLDISTVDGTNWDEPEPAYCAHYPHNQTFQTEAGHLVEFDNTPGQERIHLYHKAGTYIEIDVNGTMVRKTVGDNYEIIENNNSVFVRGAYKLTVEGATQILVKNDVDLQVYGKTNATFNNDVNMNIAGNMNVIAGGNFNVKAAGINLEATGAFNAYTGGGIGFTAGGNFDVVAQNTSIDGGDINFNSGVACAIAPIGLGAAPSAKSPESTSTPPMQKPDCTPDAFDLDAGEPGADAINAKQVESGEVINMQSKESASGEANASTASTIICNCDEFRSFNVFPDTIKLSKYYNLGNLSSKAAVVREAVVAQRNLSKPQIVCNLKNLAVNCLDRIKEKYPDMLVTNAFRTDKVGRAPTSDHGTGMAADLQFSRATASDYYSIALWIAENIPYKQLLLEYGGGARNPWIHIAYDSAGTKSALPYATFKDHSVYARNRFVNLA